MIKKILLMVVVFLLVISTSLAITEYNIVGGNDSNFFRGNGIFDSGNNDLSVGIKSREQAGANDIPLVADLDGDGINEIINLDLPNLRLFQTKDLTLLKGITVVSDEFVSNMIVFDIDGDGFKEIIFMLEESGTMRMFQWNGTDLTAETSFDISNLTFANSNGISEYMIRCGGVQQCIIAYHDGVAVTGNDELMVAKFNTSGFFNPTLLFTSTDGAEDNVCFPNTRTISFKDVNADGKNLYVFSAMEFDRFRNDIIVIPFIELLANGSLVVVQQVEDDDFSFASIDPHDPSGTPSIDCKSTSVQSYENLFTSPLVIDLEDESDGLETIIGVSSNGNDFGMIAYRSSITGVGKCNSNDACQLDEFPETTTADGIILSNPFAFNAFADTGNLDVCILGYDGEEQELDLLCGTKRETPTIIKESRQYKFSTSNLTNISLAYRNMDILTHAVEMKTQSGLDDTTELITTFGVFEIDNDETFEITIALEIIKTLNRIFQMPRSDGVAIPVDVEKINIPAGSEDILYLTETNLFYFDDGRSNSPATITQIFTNPCIDAGAIKVNTTFTATITVDDPDDDPVTNIGDDVSARMTIYVGDVNEQTSGFSGNFTDLTEISFSSLLINKTTATGTMTFEGRDVENPTIIDTVTKPFTVGLSGVEFGDCTSTFIIIPEVTPEEEVIILDATFTEDASDNAITSGINTVISLTGLAGTTFWLILMLAFSSAIYFRGASIGWTGNAILGAIAFVNFLFIILGARVGVLPVSLVVIITLITVVITAVFLAKFITGLQGAPNQ